MKVVTMYRAAKIAAVSKQAIFDLKKRNADGKSNYSFFCYDPKTGKHGINVDYIKWKKYLDRGEKKYRQGKEPVKSTTHGVVKGEQDNDVRFNNLLLATKKILERDLKLGKKAIDKILFDIGVEFEGMGE